ADPDELSQGTNLSAELISSLVEEAKKLMEEKEIEKEEALAEEIDASEETGTEKEDLPETEEKAEDHESQNNSAQDVVDTLHGDLAE
ncbi:MAG: hypothetical protein DRP37_08430, partial [Thermodesulfobacteriota bacterium]